jgi:phenylalanyl-tRNA synthetase alpha chain
MLDHLEQLRREALDSIAAANSPDTLEATRVRYLGRKGALAQLIGQVPSLPADRRPAAGKLANEVKHTLTDAFEQRKATIGQARPAARPLSDVTIPGIPPRLGHLHPVSRAWNELVGIFARIGFEVAYGPDLETDYYNFEALNMPPEHPARDAWDTLYIDDTYLLRTHTSPVQIHAMETRQPPIRIVIPGKCFRRDTADANHSPVFHQLEGLAVDTNITFADLKATLSMAMRAFFGPDTRTRFRPSFFPFTEPSAEVDISCTFCHGKGCAACGGKGWTELLGAGMVDPNVFKAVGYDPEKYTGFAFGMGIDRAAMYRFGINDLRLLFENDLRLLRQL